MISNKESVRLGTEKIVAAYEKAVAENAREGFDPARDDYRRNSIVYDIANDYNPDYSYTEAVSALNHRVIERFYPDIANTEQNDSYSDGMNGMLSYV